jgi:predicted esterase
MIGGFSQGGSLALYMGLTYEKQLAGIIGMSTFIYQHEKLLELIPTSKNLETPILMCHGTADQVVKFEWGKMTYERVKEVLKEKTGKEPDHVVFKQYKGMQHSASDEELSDVIQFMSERLK